MPENLEFEWDDQKARQNLRKHGVSFLRASLIFESATVDRIDDREDYNEVRHVALGCVGTEVYLVVYTPRGQHLLRLISARKASPDEEEIYYREVFAFRN